MHLETAVESPFLFARLVTVSIFKGITKSMSERMLLSDLPIHFCHCICNILSYSLLYKNFTKSSFKHWNCSDTDISKNNEDDD